MENKDVADLVLRYRKGDTQAKNTLIVENMVFAQALAKRFAKRHRANPEGIISTAYVSLCETIEYLKDYHDLSNPKGIIANKLRYDVTTFIAYDRTLALSRTVFYNQLTEGKLQHVIRDAEPVRSKMPPIKKNTDLEEILEDLPIKDSDRTMLRLVSQGYQIQEVGKMMGVRHQRVSERCTACGNMLRKQLNKGRLGYEYSS